MIDKSDAGYNELVQGIRKDLKPILTAMILISKLKPGSEGELSDSIIDMFCVPMKLLTDQIFKMNEELKQLRKSQ